MTKTSRSDGVQQERSDYAEALRKALQQGMIGSLHRVEDQWGGYWQCSTPHGPYNFRTIFTEQRND